MDETLEAFLRATVPLDARDVESARVQIQTTSGDVLLRDADLQELDSRATSGNGEVDQRTARLASRRVEATSGDVVLRLPRDASFRADARHTSGDVQVDFGNVISEPREEPSSFRHGTGGAQIRVKTTSGNLTISPR